MADTNENITFEQALNRLEEIVGQLERGQLSLEDSMAAFEEGMKLRKHCEERLSAAEKKIEKLVREANGSLQWQDADEKA